MKNHHEKVIAWSLAVIAVCLAVWTVDRIVLPAIHAWTAPPPVVSTYR